MYYPRYFKLGQNISLKRIYLDPGKKSQSDILSGQIASCDETQMIVHFPYQSSDQAHAYPFFPGMPFEMHSEYHGIGVQASVSFEALMSSGLVCLVPSGNLQFYYLKEQQRSEITAWTSIFHGNNDLLSMRRKWRRQSEKTRAEKGFSPDTAFVKTELELGEDGLNLRLDSKNKTSDLVIVYLALDDGQPLICILAEIVQIEETTEMTSKASLHFINILEEDQVRIRKYLRNIG